MLSLLWLRTSQRLLLVRRVWSRSAACGCVGACFTAAEAPQQWSGAAGGRHGSHLLFSCGMMRANQPAVVKEEETQLGRRRGLGIKGWAAGLGWRGRTYQVGVRVGRWAGRQADAILVGVL